MWVGAIIAAKKALPWSACWVVGQKGRVLVYRRPGLNLLRMDKLRLCACPPGGGGTPLCTFGAPAEAASNNALPRAHSRSGLAGEVLGWTFERTGCSTLRPPFGRHGLQPPSRFFLGPWRLPHKCLHLSAATQRACIVDPGALRAPVFLSVALLTCLNMLPGC